MITDELKNIYNLYLQALGKANNRAFRKKIKFEDFEEDDKNQLLKLSRFFNQYKHINPLSFFNGVFKQSEEKFLSLDFMNSRKAIISYSKFCDSKYDKFIDSDESLESMKEGFSFILKFLLINNQNVLQYTQMLNENGVPFFLIHLKEQNISLYNLHAIKLEISDFPTDYSELYLHDYKNKYFSTRQSYYNSTKMKNMGDKVYQLADKRLKK